MTGDFKLLDTLRIRQIVLNVLGLSMSYVEPRENKGTERDSEGVGWDMSIPQRLIIDWLLNGSLFPETSA